MPAYYNEFDPYAAQWLRNLIAAGELPAGDVDERSIQDVQPEDLNGYEQCHFFAGIGVWPAALRRIGWPDNRPIWTGSCPCQPFSAAGKQLGVNDERHLWPAWFHLIAQRRPAIVVGEQVASALGWLDIVQNDLEAARYAVGAADLCAPGFPVEGWHESPQHEWLLRAIRDCPDPVVAEQLLDFAAWASGNLGAHDGDHIRQRLYFVGLADGDIERCGKARNEHIPGQRAGFGRSDGGVADPPSARPFPRAYSGIHSGEESAGARYGEPERPCATSGLDDGERIRRDAGRGNHPEHDGQPLGAASAVGRVVNPDGSAASGMADGHDPRLEGHARHGDRSDEPRRVVPQSDGPSDHAYTASATHAPDNRRGAADWLYCRDGKWRPVEPGTFPLANAPAGRVGKLRAYGNALDFETVVSFLRAVVGCLP